MFDTSEVRKVKDGPSFRYDLDDLSPSGGYFALYFTVPVTQEHIRAAKRIVKYYRDVVGFEVVHVDLEATRRMVEVNSAQWQEFQSFYSQKLDPTDEYTLCKFSRHYGGFDARHTRSA